MNDKRILLYAAIVSSALFILGTSESSVTVFTIGDSTMASIDTSNNNPQRGWAQMLPQFFDNSVTVINAARGGRSAKSFYTEGLWSAVISEVKIGDYVFIQFAHNDEDSSAALHTDPWTSYTDYLTKYVTETRERGGIPVFFTPICRRYFGSDGFITVMGQHNVGPGDSTGDYPMAMRALARQMNVPLIDLTAKTKALYEAYGISSSGDLFITADQTHPNILGATLIARSAALGLKEQNVNPLAFHVDTLFSTSVKGMMQLQSEIPVTYALFQNYPNPFNPTTTIRFNLPERSNAKVEIYDIRGKKIAVLTDGMKPAGVYTVTFNAERLSSSIYFCKLITDKYIVSKKMLLIN